jgi:hypothetical protein
MGKVLQREFGKVSAKQLVQDRLEMQRRAVDVRKISVGFTEEQRGVGPARMMASTPSRLTSVCARAVRRLWCSSEFAPVRASSTYVLWMWSTSCGGNLMISTSFTWPKSADSMTKRVPKTAAHRTALPRQPSTGGCNRLDVQPIHHDHLDGYSGFASGAAIGSKRANPFPIHISQSPRFSTPSHKHPVPAGW